MILNILLNSEEVIYSFYSSPSTTMINHWITRSLKNWSNANKQCRVLRQYSCPLNTQWLEEVRVSNQHFASFCMYPKWSDILEDIQGPTAFVKKWCNEDHFTQKKWHTEAFARRCSLEGAFKNFANFIGRHPCQSQSRPATLLIKIL